MLEKKRLRAKIKQQRAALDDQLCKDWSLQVQERFLNSEYYSSAGIIHCYVSMNSRKEVETDFIIKNSLIDQKTVFIPVMDTENNVLLHARIHDVQSLTPNDWGVPEPENANVVNSISPDIIIVPLLAADKNGNRLGYGKGYYDRFLASASATKIGLVFDQFIVDRIPVESHDIQLDILITETQTIKV